MNDFQLLRHRLQYHVAFVRRPIALERLRRPGKPGDDLPCRNRVRIRNCRFESHVPDQVIHEQNETTINPLENTNYLHLTAFSENENNRVVKPFQLPIHALRHQVGEAPKSTPWSPRCDFFTLSHALLRAEVTKR